LPAPDDDGKKRWKFTGFPNRRLPIIYPKAAQKEGEFALIIRWELASVKIKMG